MKTTSKRLAVRSVFVAGIVAITMPVQGASAGAYPPEFPVGPYLVADPNPVVVNDEFDATVFPCSAGEIVVFTFEGTTLTGVCTNPEATVEFTAPSTPGVYVVRAVIDGRTLLRNVSVISETSAAGMPDTGSSDPTMMLSVGLSILLTGAALYFVATRRRTAAL